LFGSGLEATDSWIIHPIVREAIPWICNPQLQIRLLFKNYKSLISRVGIANPDQHPHIPDQSPQIPDHILRNSQVSKTNLINMPTKYFLPSLGILYLIISYLMFQYLGIKVVSDSPRYLDYAANIRESGFYIEEHNIWYVSYPIFILLLSYLHPSLELIIFAQYALGGLALLCLYLAVRDFSQNEWAAGIAGLLYLLYFKNTLYPAYILTESLYSSLTCISLWCLVQWRSGKWGMLGKGFSCLIFLAAIFCKPTGIALLGALMVPVLYSYWKKIPSLLFKSGLVLFALAGMMVLLNAMFETFNVLYEYERGDLIYGMFLFEGKDFHPYLSLEPPSDLYMPDKSYSVLIQVIFFVVYNPWFWFRQFIGKLLLFFLHVRPFWSWMHNIHSLLLLLPTYFFAVRFLKSRQMDRSSLLFSVVFIGIHALSVGIMTEDWDGRFLSPILPLIFGLAGIGLAKIPFFPNTEYTALSNT